MAKVDLIPALSPKNLKYFEAVSTQPIEVTGEITVMGTYHYNYQ